MYIKLSAKDAKQLKKHISGSKKYSVLEAVQMIEFLEKEALRLEVKETFIVIIRENNKVVLRDEIVVGQGDGIHYLVYLENKLKKLSPDTGFELTGDKKRIMDQLKEQFAKGEDSNSLHSQNSHIESGTDLDKISVLERLSDFVKSQSIFVLGMALLVLSVVGLSAYYAMTPSEPTKEKVAVQAQSSMESLSVESIESQVVVDELAVLLEQKRFEEALEHYPQEYPLIERTIFYLGLDGIPYLEDFLKIKDYGKGWYDLAYLKKDYTKVIELKAEADTDERLTQLAVAYVKTGAIAEAEALNGQLMVESINALIIQAKEAQAIQLIKENKWEEAQQIQNQIQSERIRIFYEEIGKADAAIQEINQKLAVPELKEEDRKTLEAQKQQIEQQKQLLIQQL
ncbi:hypothetical protein NHG29_03090 [Aerococcaceae bacterium NML160702]|nr:hypothetical protein [Aerococcaceae bacterium NML191219]MCW6681853.1 hypothetical protein [Aerococcaceae bacterium NML160702]